MDQTSNNPKNKRPPFFGDTFSSLLPSASGGKKPLKYPLSRREQHCAMMRSVIPRARTVARRLLSSNAVPPVSSVPSDLSKYGEVLGGRSITPGALETFQAWHEGVTAVMEGRGDLSGIEALLSPRVNDDVKFYPPTYFNHWTGRDEFIVLMTCVSEVFGTSFTYGRQFLSEDGLDWCLEFEAEIEGEKKSIVQGVDMVKLDEEGRIIEFKVLCRPPNAVAALKDAMMRKVPVPMAQMKAKKALGSLFGGK